MQDAHRPAFKRSRRAKRRKRGRGRGAVELDALEALRPGELEELVRAAIDPYLDANIRSRLRQAEEEAEQELAAQWAAHTQGIAERLAVIDQEVQQITDTYRERLQRAGTVP